MTKEQIEAVFERVRSWPIEQQEETAIILLSLEERSDEIYELSDEERRDLEEGLAEVARGEVASDEEVRAVFDRYK